MQMDLWRKTIMQRIGLQPKTQQQLYCISKYFKMYDLKACIYEQ